MTTAEIPYDKWLDEALRGVIHRALTDTAANGLPGAHHFYITFETGAPGVVLPDELRRRYPDEMTIILQHQFWELSVEPDAFAVTLKFGGRHTRLTVPLAAITAFGDPSVNFGLQLKPRSDEQELAEDSGEEDEQSDGPPATAGEGARGEVIALDTFRKK